MKYEVNILNVKDADAIVIKYQATGSERWVTVVIDAGNVGDASKVKKCIGKDKNGKYRIDYAFCTHPDKDHKGGFFELLGDDAVDMKKLCLIDPWKYLDVDDFKRVNSNGSAMTRARAPFNSPMPDDKNNLIELAKHKGIFQCVTDGYVLEDIPMQVIGPQEEYYKECVRGMVDKFAEIKEDPDTSVFDENAFPDQIKAKSVIDEDDDPSYTNMTSIVLKFAPEGHRCFLLCGDASCASLKSIIDKYGAGLKHSVIKVPHHGSKHNLNTMIIDLLSPCSAVISAKGSKKHPNSAIVTSLSRYCDVYSTHKSGWLTYRSEPPTKTATPLKEKEEEK